MMMMFPTAESVCCFVASFLLIVGQQSPISAQDDGSDYMKREHSLVKPYQGTGISLPFWDYIGSTIVSSNYVRLTPDQQSKRGGIWNQVPCMSRNWEVIVQFKVHGKSKELFGDGLVIWYTKDRMSNGPVFGSMDYFSGLAIILDTYSNHNGPHNHGHPYLSAMVNNGTLTYDHDRDGTLTQLAGCETKIRNIDHDTLISIRYEEDVLTVATDIENRNDWKNCFTSTGVRLPTGYYFGASAETGDLSDNHDLVGFKFYEISPTNPQEANERRHITPEALTFSPPRERREDIKPTWSNGAIFVFILFGMICVVILAIVGIMYYQKHQENSRKLW